MGRFAFSPGPIGQKGYSVALIALALFGILQFCFLTFNAVFQFPHWVMMVEAAAALLVTLVCVRIVGRAQKKVGDADAAVESQLSYLADFATDLYWETDLVGIVTSAGGRMMSTIMPDLNRIVGQHYLDVIKLEESEMQKMTAALREIKPYSDILSKLHDPQGKRYFISLSATPRFNASGDIVGYLGVGTNVTRRIEAQGRLRHMAEHDMLTGLANRYSFQNRIDGDVSDSDDDDNVALLAIDLDNFKAINDTWGHHAGDQVLIAASKVMMRNARKTDEVGRYGGEEFAMLLPGTSARRAAQIAERIRRKISDMNVIVDGNSIEVTASFGVACFPSTDIKNMEDLLKAADKALYEAKESGRNKVVTA